MKNNLLTILSLCSLLLIMGCSESALDSGAEEFRALDSKNVLTPGNETEMRAPAPGDQTIANIVINSASSDEDAEFTLLLDALVFTGLADVFTNDNQFTVFAPTDEAFGNLVAALADDLDEVILNDEGPFAAIDNLLGEGTVSNVLLYHVTEGRRAAVSVVPKNPRTKARKINTLLEGATFSVNYRAEITAVGNTAKVINTDISASNGIIHVIDTVILPVKI
jgi:uncharacterized surface protein with fasciclin (FAS1) repeats